MKDQYLSVRRKLGKIDYCSKSQLSQPLEKRDSYQGAEIEQTHTGQVDGRDVRLKYRLIYIWSERKARDESKTRERHIEKIREEFETVTRNLNKFSLKKEDAIVLLFILVWALMVMALMERSIRNELDGKPLYGLYPENRPSPAPTGKAMFECFETLSIVIIKHKGDVTRRLADLDNIQRKIVKLLGIPPSDLRTFKRRCGM